MLAQGSSSRPFANSGRLFAHPNKLSREHREISARRDWTGVHCFLLTSQPVEHKLRCPTKCIGGASGTTGGDEEDEALAAIVARRASPKCTGSASGTTREDEEDEALAAIVARQAFSKCTGGASGVAREEEDEVLAAITWRKALSTSAVSRLHSASSAASPSRSVSSASMSLSSASAGASSHLATMYGSSLTLVSLLHTETCTCETDGGDRSQCEWRPEGNVWKFRNTHTAVMQCLRLLVARV